MLIISIWSISFICLISLISSIIVLVTYHKLATLQNSEFKLIYYLCTADLIYSLSLFTMNLYQYYSNLATNLDIYIFLTIMLVNCFSLAFSAMWAVTIAESTSCSHSDKNETIQYF